GPPARVGPFAPPPGALALASAPLQGPDAADPACADRPAEPTAPRLDQGIAGLRVAVAGGHFAQLAEPAPIAAVERVARALGASRRVTIPEVQRARAAASVITSTEGAFNHLDDLKRRAKDFDPMTRDRFR